MQKAEKNTIGNHPALEELLKETAAEKLLFITVDGKDAADFMHYLCYRVEMQFFSCCCADLQDFTWKEFVSLLSSTKYLLDPAKAVLQMALDDFSVNPSDFSSVPDRDDTDAPELGKTIPVVELCQKEDIPLLIGKCISKAELAHFQYLLADRADYTWQQYIHDLQVKDSLRRSMLYAFQRGLAALDVKKYWESPEILERYFYKYNTTF